MAIRPLNYFVISKKVMDDLYKGDAAIQSALELSTK